MNPSESKSLGYWIFRISEKIMPLEEKLFEKQSDVWRLDNESEAFSEGDVVYFWQDGETEKQGFDLIITDIVMPNISGLAIISIVKKKCPGIPVIAITGWGEHPETLAVEAQADLVLEKPFELNELDDVIKDLISRKKTHL